MQVTIDLNGDKFLSADLKVLSAYQKSSAPKTKGAKAETSISVDHWTDKTLKEEFQSLRSLKNFKAGKDDTLTFSGAMGETVLVVGLGERGKSTAEDLRKTTAKIFKSTKGKYQTIAIDVPGFNTVRDEVLTSSLMTESIMMSDYTFDTYKSKKSEPFEQTIFLSHVEKKNSVRIEKALSSVRNITSSINICKDF